MSRYYSYSYCFPQFLLPLWKLIFCKRGWHAWDEVYSSVDHYLYCDACAEYIHIVGKDT